MLARHPDQQVLGLMYELLLFTFHTVGVFTLGIWFGRVNDR